jgi:hypothetical protein
MVKGCGIIIINTKGYIQKTYTIGRYIPLLEQSAWGQHLTDVLPMKFYECFSYGAWLAKKHQIQKVFNLSAIKNDRILSVSTVGYETRYNDISLLYSVPRIIPATPQAIDLSHSKVHPLYPRQFIFI